MLPLLVCNTIGYYHITIRHCLNLYCFTLIQVYAASSSRTQAQCSNPIQYHDITCVLCSFCIGGFLNDRLGRKPVIIVASMVFMAGALCMAMAPTREVLLVGRIIVGAGIGLYHSFPNNGHQASSYNQLLVNDNDVNTN